MMIRILGFLGIACVLVACAPDKPGCLDNPRGNCVPAAPCGSLTYEECAEPRVAAFVLSEAGQRPPGLDAAGAVGDFVLQNALVTAVIDAPDHPAQLAVSGGHLVDLAPAGAHDHLSQVSHVTGILPRDAVKYTEVSIGEAGGDRATVIARGHLFGDERVIVVTRYELRPCDPGVRMRTEVYNGSRIAQAIYLADAYFWGNRGLTPFVPLAGEGFSHPPLNLVEIDKAFRTFPFMSAMSHNDAEGDVSYAAVACDRPALQGVNTTTLSAAGTARNVVMPGDGIAFERVLLTAAGRGSAPAQKLAMVARASMFNEHYVKVKGSARFADKVVPAGTERELSLRFIEGELDSGTPWAEVVPDEEGRYDVFLPPNRTYTVEVTSYGQEIVPPGSVSVADQDETFVLQNLPRPGRLRVVVEHVGTNAPLDAEVILVPAGRTEGKPGSLYGLFGTCNPYLGSPHGSSPACNRVLVPRGLTTFSVPPGDYWVYATHGPYFTLARQRAVVESGTIQQLHFMLEPLDLLPAGSLGADFHVHGGRSFDTHIPDYDRVVSFLASGLHVLAATDHDVVGSYADELARLDALDRLVVMPGVEMTGLVLFYHREGSVVPRTLGHFNFWPLAYDPLMPRNGAPWDELQEPGELYDLMSPLTGPDGVSQLNHPYAESLLGRDEGYARAIGYDVRKPVAATPDTTPEGQWRRQPKGGSDNLGHHVQEVMNGASLLSFLEYRALWLSFLKQGIVRAGTANSDTHTLNIEQAGYPRNIVLGAFDFPALDISAFNAAVREGRMIGSNGPIIEATLRDAQGVERGPSVLPLTPEAGAKFTVTVKAAPWIPVQELRVMVNGEVAVTVPMSLMAVADPFGTDGVIRYQGEIPVSDLLSQDGFVYFEAGLPLPESADLEPKDEDGAPVGDGVPDTLDFNGDGVIGEADEEVEDKRFPLARATEDDPRFHLDVVTPGTWPLSFTNPFLIDFAGNGWEAPGL